MKRYALGLNIGLSLLFSMICVLPAQAATYKQAEYIMGTVFEITVDTPKTLDAPQKEALFSPLFARLRRYDKALSDYDPQSDLRKMVRAVQNKLPEDTLKMPDILCTALIRASFFHAMTGGVFDITVSPLVRLWGFKDQNFRVPSDAEIAAAKRYTGFKGVRFDAAVCHIQSLPPVEHPLDFGAMGKGMAIDDAIGVFKKELLPKYSHIKGLAINGGGSSAYFWGAPEATPQGWPVLARGNVTLPPEFRWLKNKGLSVSGHDQQAFVYQGKRYSHIINPVTGYPVPYQGGSLYVLADHVTEADILSTTLQIAPPPQRPALFAKMAAGHAFTYWQAP